MNISVGGKSLVTGSYRHPYSERGADLYQTPAVAVRALLSVESLPKHIWEPACGRGAIVRELRAAGHVVVASDIMDYGLGDAEGGRDFFQETASPGGIRAIVTNPPFMFGEQFVAHALNLVPTVVMLFRLAFLESEKRRPILDTGHLARVHVFRKRLPMMHRDGWEGKRGSSAMAFGWFCFDRTHRGPTTLHRLSWEPFA